MNIEKLGFLNKTHDHFRFEENFQVDDYIETVFEGTESAIAKAEKIIIAK